VLCGLLERSEAIPVRQKAESFGSTIRKAQGMTKDLASCLATWQSATDPKPRSSHFQPFRPHLAAKLICPAASRGTWLEITAAS
jgi:hypothetical protein